MAAPTITQIVTQIAPISEVLASNDVSNGSLFGEPLNYMWPLQIYVETQACLWRYNGENISTGGVPSQTMINNANYLYSIICGKYGQMAQSFINPGGIIPVPGSGGTGIRLPLIGIAGRGFVNDPTVGITTFQSDDLIGLGSTNNGYIQLFVNKIPMDNFEPTPDFVYDPIAGTLDFSPIAWEAGNTIYVDRNQ